MIIGSRAIVTGKVLSVESASLNGDYDIYTYITLKVESVLKGNITSKQIVLKEPGGVAGQRILMVYGVPQFTPGERVLVYIDTWADGSLRVHEMFLGKFSIVSDPRSGKYYVDRTAPSSHVELVEGSEKGTATSWLELDKYLRLIRNRLAADAGLSRAFEEKYYRNSPMLAAPAEYSEYSEKAVNGALQPQFHLFSPPVRWFEPDSGQPVTYLLNPDQEPGPNTAADIDAAMNAWSTVPGCSLRVVDGGTTSQCEATGVGIVDFNNCLGYFPPGSGTGILAIGGWGANGANSKVVNGTTFYQIVSGFVTVNPNDQADLSDDLKVREIVTHEMGHTLGMQHSWDPSYGGSPTAVEMDATMYYIAHFDGRGASLRSDDIAGISFIYPSSGGGPPPLQITTQSLPRGTVGVSYSTTLAATGGTAPYNWSLSSTSGPLPDGLTIASNGVIGGTPLASGTFNFTVQVTDSGAMSAQAQFSIQVLSAPPPLAVTTTSLARGSVGSAYSASLAATGGTQPYSWRLATGSGPLPPGLGLSSAGAITGTPSSGGTFDFTVQVSDSASDTATAALSITVDSGPASLAITTTSLPDATLGFSYSTALAASGGTQPYSWSLAAGSAAPPPGLGLFSAGSITGTPSSSGTFSFTVQVSDGASQTATEQLTLVVDSGQAPLAVTTTVLPHGTVGGAYSAALAAAGGTQPYIWALASGSGAMPSGLSLSAAGVISGSPSGSAGTSNITVQVSDSASHTATAQLSITIETQASGQFDSSFVSQSVPSTLSPGQTFTVSMTWKNTGTSQWNEGLKVRIGSQNPADNTNWNTDRITFLQYTIPPGTQVTLTIGNFTAPTTPGIYNFQWQLVQDDGIGFFGDASTNIAVTVGNPGATPSVQTTSIAGAQVGKAFNQQLTAAGGMPPYTWSISGSPLPGGLTLNSSTGVISGTPTQAGNFTFVARVTDSASQSAQKTLAISIAPAPLSINSPMLPVAVTGVAYSQQLTASGGIAPLTWTVTGGALPGGLELDSASGVISGSPTMEGTFSFSVTATDQQRTSASISLQILVVSPGSVPQIDSVKYKPGGGKLIIRGQNFDAGAVVLLDGAPDSSQAPVKSRSGNKIVVKPLLLGSGSHQIQVVNSNNVGSNLLQFTVN